MRAARRRRLLAAALSVGVHAGVLAVLIAAWRAPAPVAELEAMQVALVEFPRPPKPSPEPPKLAAPESPPHPPPKLAVRPPRRPPPPQVAPLPATPAPPAERPVEVGDSELASARTAGSGGGPGTGAGAGERCDMVRWLEKRLRRDRMVQLAVADVHRGKAIRVWNGAWVRQPGQEGGGLAKVREVIMWEVGFAPEACKSEPVSGLVAISLDDAPGSARIVLGQNRWAWKDLLFAQGGPTVRR